jgi:hypothetical protein
MPESQSQDKQLDRLSFELIIHLIQISLEHCFVVEKIVRAIPSALYTISDKLVNKSYSELLHMNYYGVMYVKWKRTGEIPTVYFLKEAVVLNKVDALRIYDKYFRSLASREPGYVYSMDQCTQLACNLGHLDVLNYMYVECKRPFPDHIVHQIFVHSDSQDIIDFLTQTLGVKPARNTFYEMMCSNTSIDFTTCIPEGVPIRAILLAYGSIYGDDDSSMVRKLLQLKDQCSKEELTFSRDELQIYLTHCDIHIPEAWQQAHMIPHEYRFEDVEDARHWKLLEYLWYHFEHFPSECDLGSIFVDTLYNKDIDGVKFLFEKLGWRPRDIGRFYDAIFEDSKVADYVMQFLTIDEVHDLHDDSFYNTAFYV